MNSPSRTRKILLLTDSFRSGNTILTNLCGNLSKIIILGRNDFNNFQKFVLMIVAYPALALTWVSNITGIQILALNTAIIIIIHVFFYLSLLLIS